MQKGYGNEHTQEVAMKALKKPDNWLQSLHVQTLGVVWRRKHSGAMSPSHALPEASSSLALVCASLHPTALDFVLEMKWCVSCETKNPVD